MMICAVMLDLKSQETYVELFEKEKDYDNVLSENSDIRHPTSIFNNEKDAKREAKRVANFSTGYIYNKIRNKTINE